MTSLLLHDATLRDRYPSEWLDLCDAVLPLFIKKVTNQKTVCQCLWKRSEQNLKMAQYLLYEVFTEYLIHPKRTDVFLKLQNDQLYWHHADLQKVRERMEEHDQFLVNPPDVEEGVIQCHRCQSFKTFSFSKQTRRADESSTVFVRCCGCHATFRL